MTVALIAVHHRAEESDKLNSLTALVLICLNTGITSCVHFSILALGHTAEAQSLPGFAFWFSFRWPSVVYALDILAWDWFFGLSMLFLAPVFWRRRPLSELLVLSGVLSLAGLLGVALENMPIRNIGILGCAVAAPVASLRI